MWRKLRSLLSRNPPVRKVDLTPRRRSLDLLPTPSGKAIAAAGKIETCEDDSWQYVALAIRANLSDGTHLLVLLNHQPAGSIVVCGCEAEWELGVSEDETLPHGLPAAGAIKTVMVATADGTAVLTGAFPKVVQRAAANWG